MIALHLPGRTVRFTNHPSVKMCLVLFLLMLTLYGSGISQGEQNVTVTRWNNDKTTGSLVGFSEDGQQLILETDSGRKNVSVSELLKIDVKRSSFTPDQPTVVRLRGNGILKGEIMESGEDTITMKIPGLADPLELKLTRVDRITFPFSQGSVDRDEVETDNNDVLYKSNGDIYKGFVSSVSPKKIQFDDRNLGERSFSLDQVLLLDLAPIGEPPTTPDSVYLEVHGKGGSVFPGTPVSSTGEELRLKSFFDGLTWNIPIRSIETILVKNGKTTYLSDLEPSEVTQKQVFPWQTRPEGARTLSERYHWRRDQSVPDLPGRNEPIKIKDTTYEKGIGCTPYTRLTYDLNGNFSRFQSTIGLDRRSKHPRYEGSVVFRVYVDGTEKYSSGEQTYSSLPKEIDVDVSGAERMSIEVDLGTGFLDFANWAGARLIRNNG